MNRLNEYARDIQGAINDELILDIYKNEKDRLGQCIRDLRKAFKELLSEIAKEWRCFLGVYILVIIIAIIMRY